MSMLVRFPCANAARDKAREMNAQSRIDFSMASPVSILEVFAETQHGW
jgi:hypothetical protein